MNAKIENALSVCGQHRVFINSGSKPIQIAIRWEPEIVGKDEAWIRAEGESDGMAGELAAIAFATRLRTRGSDLIAWAERIERALAGR